MMRVLMYRFCFILSAAAMLTTTTAGVAAEPHGADKPVHCLSTLRIRSSDVLSHRFILFRMTDRTAYINELSHPCPGLSSNDPFMYRTSIGQLCDLDIVTVLENSGFGLMPGASCGLGMFKPIDGSGIKDLKQGLKDGSIQ